MVSFVAGVMVGAVLLVIGQRWKGIWRSPLATAAVIAAPADSVTTHASSAVVTPMASPALVSSPTEPPLFDIPDWLVMLGDQLQAESQRITARSLSDWCMTNDEWAGINALTDQLRAEAASRPLSAPLTADEVVARLAKVLTLARADARRQQFRVVAKSFPSRS